MTKKVIISSIFFFLGIAISTTNAQSKFDSWQALKDFHKVMSQTFHPSEEGNLQPIKTRSGEMVEKAAALKKSTIPAEFDKKEVRAAVKQLVKDSKTLDKMIKKNASDAAITNLYQLCMMSFIKSSDFVLMKDTNITKI